MPDEDPWADVDTDVRDGRPFWDGTDLDDGETTVVRMQSRFRPAEESQFAPVEAEAQVDGQDVLFAPSAKTLLSDLKDLDPRAGDQVVVSVEGTGMDRYYSAEALD